MPERGRVVILNGTSSSGKSTLAARFRDDRAVRGEVWLVVALDDFLTLLPARWYETPSHHGCDGTEGISMLPGPDGLVVRAGPVGRRLLDAYRATVGAWARAGFDVVVDEVVFVEEFVQEWEAALDGIAVTWVAVRCDPATAEARERTRPHREPGLARGLASVVHRAAPADLEIDTAVLDESQAAAALSNWINASSP